MANKGPIYSKNIYTKGKMTYWPRENKRQKRKLLSLYRGGAG